MLQALTRRLRGWMARPRSSAPSASGRAAEGEPDIPEGATRLFEAGAAALREGRPLEALASFGEAVVLCPRFALAHDHAGLAASKLGRYEDALAHFQHALEARHDCVPALTHQGIALLELKRYEEAEDSFKLALAYEPGSAQTCVSLAMACWNQQRAQEAIGYFYRALELEPGLADVRLMLAGLLHTEERLEEAAACYRQGLADAPGVPELHLNFAVTLLKLARVDEAIDEITRALALKPEFAEAYFSLGNARRDQGRPLEAIESYERALALRPDYADACSNLASVLKDLGVVDRAVACYRRAAALEPDSFMPHHNIGVLYNQIGDVQAAIASYLEVLRLKPGHPESRLNLAITRLLTGDFANGWEQFESRFHLSNTETVVLARPFSQPRWNGEPLAGKRILLWGEQGIGDEILFASLYQEVIDAAQACLIECAPKLVPLFSRSFPGARVVGKTVPPHPATAEPHDYQCPAGSVARWLRPTLESFPRRAAYLKAPPERVAYWKERLASLGAGPKIGFSWRSSNLKGERALYCTTLDQWEPIFSARGAHFVSLQYDECAAEIARARERFGIPLHQFQEVDLFNDLEEAAALTLACDLVITAPTAVAFLAGALGVPTWQMTFGADWSKHGTEGYPWFPTITLFHRIWPRTWEEILAGIGTRLRAYLRECP